MTNSQKNFFHYMGLGQLKIGDVFKFDDERNPQVYWTVYSIQDDWICFNPRYGSSNPHKVWQGSNASKRIVKMYPYRSASHDSLCRENITAKTA